MSLSLMNTREPWRQHKLWGCNPLIQQKKMIARHFQGPQYPVTLSFYCSFEIQNVEESFLCFSMSVLWLTQWINRSKLLFLRGITVNLIHFILQNMTESAGISRPRVRSVLLRKLKCILFTKCFPLCVWNRYQRTYCPFYSFLKYTERKVFLGVTEKYR